LKKYKILAIADSAFAATGYGNQSEVILTRLVKRGWDVYQLQCNAYTMHKCEPGEEYPLYKGIKIIPNVEVQRLGMEGLYGTKESLWEIYNKIKPDIIWSCNDFYRVAGLTEFSDEFVDRFVYWMPVDNPYCADNWAGDKDHFLNRMRFVIFMSYFGWELTAKYLPYVMFKDSVYLGVPSDSFKPLYSKDELKKVTGFDNKFVILTVGRHQPRKMIWKTANAVAKFLKDHPDAVWYCKTDPNDPAMSSYPENERDLVSIMKKEGVENRAFFEPRVLSTEQMNEFYNTGDVFIHLSGGEGFGIPYVESMMAGTPCILSDNTTSPELTGNWEFGLPMKIKEQVTLKAFNSTYDLVDEHDAVKQLEFTYNDWKTGGGWLKTAGKKAREFHRQWCDADKVVDRWEEYFYRMIRYNNKLVWHSTFGRGMGYSITSETMIPELEKLGYDIYVDDIILQRKDGITPEPESSIINPHIKELKYKYLNAATVHKNLDDCINAAFYLQESFEFIPGNKKIGWAFAESTKIRPKYVPLCNRMNTIITTSEFTKKAMQDSGVTTDIRIVPPWVDIEAYPIMERPNDRPFTFLHVGMASERKNTFQLLEAYVKAFPGQDKTRMILKSNDMGILTPFQEIYKDRKDIEWVYTNDKPLTHDQMLELYKKADCYINVSHGEGIGNPEMEAMSTGLPVISSNWDGRKVFLDDEVGWMLKINGLGKAYPETLSEEDCGQWAYFDGEDMIRLLQEVASNPQLCREKGKIAAERMRERFTPSKAALALDEVFMDFYTPNIQNVHIEESLPAVTPMKVIDFDEKYFANYNLYNQTYHGDWVDIIIKDMGGLEGNTLDIGCGPGNLMMHLLAKGKNVVGIDVADWAIEHPMQGCEGRIFKGDMTNIPYDDKTFDNAVCFSVLEHIPEKDAIQALKEIKRVAKKAFLLIAMEMVPGHTAILESEDPTHINIKPIVWWEDKFKEVGLKVIGHDRMAFVVEPMEE
jgi:glycosyltransferase involved in cell wall biosynthesis/ubiquinone/menaquinone biosynthesis C-methylase UbiE